MQYWSKSLLVKYLKYAQQRKHALLALLIIGWAVYLRVYLVAQGWPLMDSDEGTMGIMALHIWRGQDFPAFFYGQSYMGALEAYLGAAFFNFFGPTLFALRLGLIFLFALFLWGMYLLVSTIYTRNWALCVLFLLSLGSASVLTRQLVAVGGIPEMQVCATGLLFLSLWLARTYDRSHMLRGWRLLIYALWGVLAGVGFWSHALILPLLGTAGLLLLIFCLRELIWGGAVALVVGLGFGLLPYIFYNYHASPGQDTLSYLLYVQSANGLDLPPKDVLFPLQIKGTFLTTLPGATGSFPLCSLADTHLWRTDTLHGLRCTLTQSGWSALLCLLWLVSLGMGLWVIYRLVRAGLAGGTWRREELIRHAGHLALLLNAALTLLLFLFSPNSALFAVADMRYLSALWMTTPALLWPLWYGLARAGWLFSSSRLAALSSPSELGARVQTRLTLSQFSLSVGALTRLSLLLLLAAVLCLGTRSVVQGYPPAPPVEQRTDAYAIQDVYQYKGVPQVQAFDRQEAELMKDLERIHVTHIYSDYWTCNRLIFKSLEHIICGVMRDRLLVGQNRYPLYYAIISSDTRASYVFPENSSQAETFHQQLRFRKKPFKLYHFVGYVVYTPLPG